jgi:catechol 2,3-dioxygenase-like lactoylglutathione lyase family enzyme
VCRFGTVVPGVQNPGPPTTFRMRSRVAAWCKQCAGSQPYHNFPKKYQRAEGIGEAYLALDTWRVAEFRIQASILRDYQAWHDQYDDPNSALAERLRIVQVRLGEQLTARPVFPRLTTSNSRKRSAWTAHGLCNTGDVTIKRLDHVSVVVDDLAAAIAFFTALGMTLEGEMPVEGPWVDRVNGLESVQVDIVMMRTPDGHGRLELTKFRNPKLVEIEPAIAPPNTLGLRSVMFTVESVDDTVARLRANGAELVGEVAQYEDRYRLCYVRGPAGIIVALAEELF